MHGNFVDDIVLELLSCGYKGIGMALNLGLCGWTMVKCPYYGERKPRQADADVPARKCQVSGHGKKAPGEGLPTQMKPTDQTCSKTTAAARQGLGLGKRK